MAEITIFYEGSIITRAEARARGLRRFFTGTPCKQHHVAEHFVISGTCVRCHLIYARSAKRKIRRQSYDQSPLARALWEAYNRSPQRKASQQRYDRSPHGRTRRKLYIRLYDQSPRGKALRRQYGQIRSAHKRAAEGTFSKSDYLKLLERQKKCHICGKRFTKADHPTIDHVVALVNGGAHEASNIALAHHGCNSRKQAQRTHLL